MKQTFNPYLFKITLFTLILLVISIILARISKPDIILPILPLIPLFFYLVNIGIHYLIVRITLKKAKQFYNYFMISTFVKLILYMAIILIYALTVRQGKISFTLSFFIFYLLYSGFEVITLSSHIKKLGKSNS